MVTKIAILCLLALNFQEVYMQECQQVTVCGNGASGGANAQKGDIGAPGKAGAPGSKGSKGDVGAVGAKGERGDTCALDEFAEEIQREVAELKKLVATPVSCSTSSVYGRQRLRSGEDVYCDGGWRVFQKRQDGSVSFDRDWTSYKNGFGDLDGEFWIGLDKIHNLTRHGGCKLRVDLWGFDGDYAVARYSSFSVEDENASYRLHATGYSGTAGDGLGNGNGGRHDGQRFSTKDRDNDNAGSSCARSGTMYRGGWWFNACFHSALNAKWGVSTGRGRNIIWNEFKGYTVALEKTTMKVKCD